ncbi:hypothetical protein [Prosthecochloris sp. HL-130-GSB]|jgi:hypothetical protein|uniref:hypothetical protein n=1 Tax=Prosthecochloris sp. HL-130-GSB TaxID=1974213 RepID=UPI000A1C12DE|nr:hypothetical protein [Prosthecochloris sp. HL-130-GSB]ARM31138.1 hypothetical protein B9H02_07330 [Prosthecochloris sp. HL-130-GSB]MBO8093588.1 hypothetical protein [Prosthecochloris sp.]
MEFLAQPFWWILTVIGCALALAPAAIKKVSLVLLAGIIGMFAALMVFVHLCCGTTALIGSLAIALLTGLFALLTSLVASGITNMLKNRYR